MRFRLVILAKFAVSVRPSGVEISQADMLESVSIVIITQDCLYHELSHSVWIYRSAKVVFGQGQFLRVAINGASRRQDEALDVMLKHGAKQDDAVGDIVFVIAARVFNRFSDIGKGGKVQHGRDLAAGKNGAEALFIRQVAFDEFAPPGGPTVPARKVVVDDDVESSES